jgi:two-component system phosphate regulon response regulator PhoB
VPDLIILDWMLPDKSGVDFLKWAKKQNDYKSIPVIMLTAKAEEENKIKGLSHGADDYITKPFSPKELMARVKAILRRGLILSPDNQLTHKNISLDFNKHEAMIDNTLIELTAIEFKMLGFFLKNPNQVFSRDQLITHIWGSSTYIEERTVDGQLRRLRDKLKQHGHENLISTVRGIGYQFRQ